MRHLWSLLAGIVAAPLAWLCLATGQYWSDRRVRDWEAAGRFDTAELVGPVLFVVAAGILLGLLGTLRWSPAGPVAAGVLLVIPTIFMFVNPFETLDAFWFEAFDLQSPQRLLGQDLQPWRPVANGTLLVLGVLLLMAVFSAQRWRQPAAGAAPATVAAPAVAAEPAAGAEPPEVDTEAGVESDVDTGAGADAGSGAEAGPADQPETGAETGAAEQPETGPETGPADEPTP